MRRRREHFRICQFRRTYDRAQGKFSFNISYETHTELTDRSLAVAEAFGLGVDEDQKFKVLEVEFKIGPRDIVYVTGDSGSGKSVLIRAIRKDLGEEAIDLSEVSIEADMPLIETVGETIEEGLDLLSKVGLNDAFLFLRTYNQLSDGQKYRYRIAKLMESGKQWWLMDEFAATLDRDTAKIVAFNLQKLARRMGKAVIAATTHGDLLEDLKPSVHVHKRFGEEITISYCENKPAEECSLTREMVIVPGSLSDWRCLSGFHYRSHHAGASRKVFCLRRGTELCGVIVYTYPPPGCSGRYLVLPGRHSMKELNSKLSTISRVVVHPKYRSIGLGSKLIRETLSMVGTPCIEMIAVMAKYNPFAEKSGLEKILEQKPSEEAKRAADVLSGLGFDLKLSGSQKYVSNKLENLSSEQLATLKGTFMKNDHPRFRRAFAANRKKPYGTSAAYAEGVRKTNLEGMAKLIRIVGMLLQTKVYLFWRKQSHPET
jgi:ABC-type transport system involved in cytochrome c biogenesis ATPase subunit/GNAT superfamily N-acetyltransferase